MRKILDINTGSLALWASQGLAWFDNEGWVSGSAPGWVRGIVGPGRPLTGDSDLARLILAQLSLLETEVDVYSAVDAAAAAVATVRGTSHDVALDAVLRVAEYIGDLDADSREWHRAARPERDDWRWQDIEDANERGL